MLNTFSLKSTEPINSIEIGQWVKKIKSPEKSLKLQINLIRSKQLDKQEEKYNLPAVCYNFLFNKKRTENNILSSTGFLFIDLDKNLEEFDIKTIDKSKVFLLYKSLSGEGYHLIVRVNNLSIETFKTTLDFIIFDLGIEDYCDKGAMKYNQLSFYSYDENLFYNENSFIYSEVKNILDPLGKYIKINNTVTIEGVPKINLRFNNIDEFRFDGQYKVDWGNIDIIEAKIPIKKVEEGRRNRILYAYGINLLWLNNNMSLDKLTSILMNTNIVMTKTPLTLKEVTIIAHSIYQRKLKGILQPIPSPKKRSIIFKQNIGLSKDDKLEIVRDLLIKKKSEDSKQKLYDIIENWDFEKYGKITSRSIPENFPISRKTVIKYYSEFKGYINELNKNNFENKKTNN